MTIFLKPFRRHGGSILTRTLALTILLACTPLAIFIFLYWDILLLLDSQHLQNIPLERPERFMDRLQIYVVSLPHRHERRLDMERLRLALGLQWDYSNAVPADYPLIGQILDWVKELRLSARSSSNESAVSSKFLWPEHINDIANSGEKIPLIDFNAWRFPTSEPPYRALTCNEYDFSLADFSPDEAPKYMRLTPGRVACWHSHVSVIHQFANSLSSERANIGLILEDDVDMEQDIIAQMESLWETLPEDWDMVFLGHCWSDETRGRLLVSNPNFTIRTLNTGVSRMYESTSPKCTHAYAVSRIGARKLLLHLTYPLFAYSRAIDQGFAWLVASGRIKSFSVVPNIVVQRKVTTSDVMEGGTVNSHWKGTLFNGVFDMLDNALTAAPTRS